ncbi:NADH-quinone oxidoreductase subunit M [Nocardioidaceae bacterium]|nr:NADH-quinone oxidoreductase subunit M [Nocardioidaceae bacterium]
MLTLLIAWPLLAGALLLLPGIPDRAARRLFVLAAAIEVVVAGVVWATYDSPAPGALSHEIDVPWIPGLDAGYHVGVDGLSLPLVLMTVVVVAACAVHTLAEDHRPARLAALLLALEGVTVGVFVAADLLLFFVFFDLSLVATYLVILGWGHGPADRVARSAVRFFLYTFLGSLAMLVGFAALFAASDPHTFDMVALAADPPFQGSGALGAAALGAVLLGLAIKTPTFPFHTWLPPAHTDAPTVGSVVLAAVLLKTGTYGFVRIAMPMFPEAWRAWAPVLLVVAIVSVLWGALVALAQTDLKRMVAYTSVNHMGYVLLGLAAAGFLGGALDGEAAEEARAVAVTGAVVLMVSHGLLTGAMFLLAGALWDRRDGSADPYDLHAYGGLARLTPRFSVLLAVAAFGSLGIPGMSGFVGEVQVFAGSLATAPWAALAVLGILVTAALMLRALHLLLAGAPGGRSTGLTDLTAREYAPVGALLALSVAIGVLPGPLVAVIEPAASAVAAYVAR